MLTCEGLLGEDDGLDLRVDLDEHVHVRVVQHFVVVEEGLQLEQSQFLHALGRVDVETLVYDFDCSIQVFLDLVPVSIARCRPTAARFAAGGFLDAAFDVLFLGQQVTHQTETVEHNGREHQTLGLHLPVLIVG